ncbi:SUKH-4 family immunity protein [Streptomyces californicus]|uniref:SUKH-4 family immunity protein n=1 Tax=Streptomyces californicus TaxID=67351 RepID=UPI0037A28F3B
MTIEKARNQLYSLYGAYGLRTAVEASWPDTLTDEESKSLLRDVGIPRGLGDPITVHLPGMAPVAEKYSFLESHRTLPRDEIFLGYIADEALLLNGTDGAIRSIATREGARITAVNTHLSTLVACMALGERLLTRRIPELRGRCPEDLVAFAAESMGRIDPLLNERGNRWHSVLRRLFENE